MELAAEITGIVVRHLREAHALIGQLLAQLEDPAASDSPKPSPARAPSPETIKRKQRQQRAAARTDSAAAEWNQLRAQFHAAVKARQLTRLQVAAELRAGKGSVVGWLVPGSAPPNDASLAKIRAWLAHPADAEAPVAPEPESSGEDTLAPFRLTDAERDRLSAYLSMQSDPEIRGMFGLTKGVLERASLGSRLDAAVIAKVRGALDPATNGAA